MPKKYSIADYPKDQLFRLFVDGKLVKKEKGFREFDGREDGCVSAMMEGFSFALSEVSESGLSKALITEVAAKCMAINHFQRNLEPGKLRYEQGPHQMTFYAMPSDKITVDGLTEYITKLQTTDNPDDFGYLVYAKVGGIIGALPREGQAISLFRDHLDKTFEALSADPNDRRDIATKFIEAASKSESKFTYVAPGSFYVDGALDRIIDSYNKEIKQATDDTSKLRVIAEHTQSFEQLHPFYDANGRVFVNCLLNTMLIENDFPPATFKDPNVFDFFSVEETVAKIEEAMDRTVKLIEHPENKMDGLKAEDLKEEDRQLLQPGQGKLSQAIDQYQAKKTSQKQEPLTAKPASPEKPSSGPPLKAIREKAAKGKGTKKPDSMASAATNTMRMRRKVKRKVRKEETQEKGADAPTQSGPK